MTKKSQFVIFNKFSGTTFDSISENLLTIATALSNELGLELLEELTDSTSCVTSNVYYIGYKQDGLIIPLLAIASNSYGVSYGHNLSISTVAYDSFDSNGKPVNLGCTMSGGNSSTSPSGNNFTIDQEPKFGGSTSRCGYIYYSLRDYAISCESYTMKNGNVILDLFDTSSYYHFCVCVINTTNGTQTGKVVAMFNGVNTSYRPIFIGVNHATGTGFIYAHTNSWSSYADPGLYNPVVMALTISTNTDYMPNHSYIVLNTPIYITYNNESPHYLRGFHYLFNCDWKLDYFSTLTIDGKDMLVMRSGGTSQHNYVFSDSEED